MVDWYIHEEIVKTTHQRPRSSMKHFFCISITIILVGCFPQQQEVPKDESPEFVEPENFDYGLIEKDIYKNAFFGIELPLNPKWHVQNREDIELRKAQARELIAGDDDVLKSKLKASNITTANLLTIQQYEVGTAVDFNPGISIVAENTKSAPGIKTGKDYHFHAKKYLQQAQLDYSFDKEIYTKKFGSRVFYVLETTLPLNGNEISQDFITTVMNGFSLSFIVSYANEDERAELYSMLENVKI